MKSIIGLLLILAGVVAGFYFGLWWAFIGGIVAIIGEIRAEHMDASTVALSVARCFFAGLIGWASALVFIIPGVALVKR